MGPPVPAGTEPGPKMASTGGAGEDAFAAFMGEVTELSEKVDNVEKVEKPASVVVAKAAPTTAAAATTTTTTKARPVGATIRAAPVKASSPAVPARAQSRFQSVMERDYERLQGLEEARRGVPQGSPVAKAGSQQEQSNNNGAQYRADRAAPSRKAFVREIGGEKWVDKKLGEWPENDFRLFVGDLGHEVSDEMLSNAFNRYASFNMARVIRENRTQKSKGFGFVSFADGVDFAKALREMNGKYIGNRPCKLKKSSWKDRGTKHSKSLAAMGGVPKKLKKNKKHLNF